MTTAIRCNYIAMLNGILKLDDLLDGRDEVMIPHTPKWFSTICLSYPFDPEAECPRWQAFLDRNLEGDQERIDLLQEWAGYLLLPDTSQQKFLLLEGEGSNGKSVFCAVIEAMLGPENCSHVPLELFAQRFALTQTLGKLANIAAEVGELDRVSEGFLKSFTSGDVMFFDRKGKPGIDASPTARLILATNNRPRFSDRSGGLWRRMLLVPFRVQIQDDEKIVGMDKPRWWLDSGEMSGVFNWAVAGLHRLRQQGRFTESTIGKEAVIDYRSEANPARTYLVEHCKESPSFSIETKVLYKAYRNWCDENGYRPLGERQFGKEVSRCFPNSRKVRGGSRDDRRHEYIGIDFD